MIMVAFILLGGHHSPSQNPKGDSCYVILSPFAFLITGNVLLATHFATYSETRAG